ncbi:MAG: DUF3500 domain-containing protein [Saprospiraceae bacterium]|nr:DUF3500 domain-containing protein [Saprospiraceae bacterium]
MARIHRIGSYIFIALVLIAGVAFIARQMADDAMIAAANAFTESLSPTEKEQCVMTLSDSTRTIWHFLPVASFDRYGMSLGELSDEQDQLVFDLMRSALSKKGFEKAEAIIALENILKVLEKDNPTRDADQYHIAIYGKPAKDDMWGWGISGHHLSLHFTMVDGKMSTTPTFMGSNPGEVKSGPKKGLRVLKAEEDLGLALINALPADQQNKAIILSEAPREIFTAAQSKVDPLDKVGIKFSELAREHQKMLYDIILEYANAMPAELAQQRMDKIHKAGWDDILFAWAGVTNRSAGHYYRIQGPTFLIEFDNTQNDANHVHTVWRDFDGDFGRDLLKAHYHDEHGHHSH